KRRPAESSSRRRICWLMAPCVRLSWRAARVTLPVSTTLKKARATATSMLRIMRTYPLVIVKGEIIFFRYINARGIVSRQLRDTVAGDGDDRRRLGPTRHAVPRWGGRSA